MKKSVRPKVAILILVGMMITTGCNQNTSDSTVLSDTTKTSGDMTVGSSTDILEKQEETYVISPQFDEASPFNEAGYAVVGEAVSGQMKYGVIDETGTYVTPTCFDGYDMPNFELLRYENVDNSIIWVRENDIWSFINEDGDWLSDCQFQDHTYFSDNGLAGVKQDGKWGFCDQNGQIVISPEYSAVSAFDENGYARVCSNGKWGTIDETGETVIEAKYQRITCSGDMTDSFILWGNGGAKIYMVDDGNYNYGLVSITGDILTSDNLLSPPIFTLDGLAQVQTEDGYAYMDMTGRIVIEEYNAVAISAFTHSYASVKCEDVDGNVYYNIINESGTVVGTDSFDDVGDFSENGLAPAAKNGEYGFIDSKGEFVIVSQFHFASTFDSNGYAVVGDGDQYAIINETGELMTQYLYEECYETRSNEEPLPFSTFVIRQNGKVGIMNECGESLLDPQYDEIFFSSANTYEGDYFLNLSDQYMAMVVLDGMKGIVSLKGELYLEPIAEQESITIAPDGMTAVCIDGKYGYIDLVP